MTNPSWRIVIRQTGGPEVLEREDFDPGAPGAGEVLVRTTAIGVNFIDTYQRTGLYPLPLPSGLGSEFAGVIAAIGSGVEGFAPGDRVAAITMAPDGYATHVVVAANLLFKLPDSIADDVAAAVMVKGLTAWMLIERCAKLQPGQSVLIHSAAGGVGSLLVPWAKSAGLTVIAHTGSAPKAERARQAGADHSFHDSYDLLAQRVRDATAGRGVDVVLDGVGAASWAASLASVAKRGLVVSYGNASGPVPPFSALELMRAGSIFRTRPTVYHYIETAAERDKGGKQLFQRIANDSLPVEIGQRFALADAAQAHQALESRQTVGSTILIP
jgi:NADPH2:quinone reductase